MLKYLHWEVETQAGDAIVVKLAGTEANVRVMGALDFSNFRRGRRFQQFGGHVTASPAIVRPPPGHWHVVVDLGGGRGSIEASVELLRA